MQVIDIKPRGYCKGVAKAIIKARETRAQYPGQPVTVLGSIVHNRHVVEALEAEGIAQVDEAGRSRLELLDLIDEGIVIFSAHGVSQAVRDKAAAKGLQLVDATCEDVLATAEIIEDWLADGGEVIYLGKHGHPESSGMCEGRPLVHLVTNAAELRQIAPQLTRPILVTNQTTLSLHDTGELYALVLELLPEATLANEICSATRVRQEAVMNHPDLDTLIVVGDPQSNNTAMLARMGEWAGIRLVLRVENVQGLAGLDLSNSERVGITSGASTPNAITTEVSNYLQAWSEAGEAPELPDTTVYSIL